MDWDLTSIFGGPMGLSLFGGPGGPILGSKGGSGPIFNDMAVPGLPKTGGLLRAGDDDFRAQAGAAPPTPGLVKAGQEDINVPQGGLLASNPVAQNLATDRGVTIGGSGGSDTLQGGTGGAYTIPATGATVPAGTTTPATPPAKPAPGAAVPTAVPLATPAGSGRMPDPDRMPSAVPTVTIPNSRGGPDERGAPEAKPIVPPKIDVTKPTAGGGTVGGQAAPPAAAPAAGGPATTGSTGQPAAGEGTGMDKFREWLSKVPAISGNKTPPPQGRSPGGVGAPHIPQGGAQLLQSILEQHAKAMPQVGPIGQLPPGLLRRFQGA